MTVMQYGNAAGGLTKGSCAHAFKGEGVNRVRWAHARVGMQGWAQASKSCSALLRLGERE